MLIWMLSSCLTEQKPEDSSSLIDAGTAIVPTPTPYMIAGDLVVTNYSGDSAILLDLDGNFKELLYNVENNQEQVIGVNWNASTSEVVLTINGYPDRVIGISATDGTQRTIIQNVQLNGNTFGIAVNSSGDFLAIESHQVEKFDSNGNRVSNGDFPTGTLFNNLAQINPLAAGGFVTCGYGGDLVATYNAAAVQVNSKASGIPATTNGYGCDELADGSIVASWEGTTDSIVVYNSTFASTLASFNDSTIISSPRGVEQKANGNILVTDVGYHYIVELSYDSVAGSLSFVQNLGGGLLNYPWQIIEIPSY